MFEVYNVKSQFSNTVLFALLTTKRIITDNSLEQLYTLLLIPLFEIAAKITIAFLLFQNIIFYFDFAIRSISNACIINNAKRNLNGRLQRKQRPLFNSTRNKSALFLAQLFCRKMIQSNSEVKLAEILNEKLCNTMEQVENDLKSGI